VTDFAEHCGATARQCDDIAVATSEALTNAVLHAYVGLDLPGEVAVRASVSDGCFEVVVSDRGSGVQPRRDSPGLGLGLGLIARLSDRLVIEDAMPGARVRMSFAIA
jgi:anti-sigma regulatory factor (Ser/Thr protein kinase)